MLAVPVAGHTRCRWWYMVVTGGQQLAAGSRRGSSTREQAGKNAQRRRVQPAGSAAGSSALDRRQPRRQVFLLFRRQHLLLRRLHAARVGEARWAGPCCRTPPPAPALCALRARAALRPPGARAWGAPHTHAPHRTCFCCLGAAAICSSVSPATSSRILSTWQADGGAGHRPATSSTRSAKHRGRRRAAAHAAPSRAGRPYTCSCHWHHRAAAHLLCFASPTPHPSFRSASCTRAVAVLRPPEWSDSSCSPAPRSPPPGPRCPWPSQWCPTSSRQ